MKPLTTICSLAGSSHASRVNAICKEDTPPGELGPFV